jgi:putative membrane protein
MMDWNGHMSGSGWIFSILAIVVVFAFVVGAVAWIARELRTRRDQVPATSMSPAEILDRRLASGEIEAEQYIQLRRTLGVRPDSAVESPV